MELGSAPSDYVCQSNRHRTKMSHRQFGSALILTFIAVRIFDVVRAEPANGATTAALAAATQQRSRMIDTAYPQAVGPVASITSSGSAMTIANDLALLSDDQKIFSGTTLPRSSLQLTATINNWQ